MIKSQVSGDIMIVVFIKSGGFFFFILYAGMRVLFKNKSVTGFCYSVRFLYAPVIHHECNDAPGILFRHYQCLPGRNDNPILIVRREKVRGTFRDGDVRMRYGVLCVFSYDGGRIIRCHGIGET